jgi:hypothetical protein
MGWYAADLKRALFSLIDEMGNSPGLFVVNPGKDFTRSRKLPLSAMLKMMISMGGNSIQKELFDYHGYHEDTATTSAFIQQREKILPFAFAFLLHELTVSMAQPLLYRGYRLLGIDGSDLHVPTNPADSLNHIVAQDGSKGYNLLHLNALYDLCGKLFLDVMIQNYRDMDEHVALTCLVDRSYIAGKAILVADRGYESYNNLAHIEKKGWNYVFRIRDHNGLIQGMNLPDAPEFDIQVSRILTKKQTNEVKARPEGYRFLPSKVHFDFLNLNHDLFYPISFRVVRFKTAENCYQTLITNLDATMFPIDILKEIYRLRWGIETSFRELKYAVGLLNFHSKRADLIAQEIYAQLIMYNFSMMITSHVIIRQRLGKHPCQVNFTQAIHICTFFFRCRNEAPPDADTLIQKCVLPIRPNRSTQRSVRSRSAASFLYRIA